LRSLLNSSLQVLRVRVSMRPSLQQFQESPISRSSDRVFAQFFGVMEGRETAWNEVPSIFIRDPACVKLPFSGILEFQSPAAPVVEEEATCDRDRFSNASQGIIRSGTRGPKGEQKPGTHEKAPDPDHPPPRRHSG
jgi:hypothetical protein